MMNKAMMMASQIKRKKMSDGGIVNEKLDPSYEANEKEMYPDGGDMGMSHGGMAHEMAKMIAKKKMVDTGPLENQDEHDELHSMLMGGQASDDQFLTAKMGPEMPNEEHYPDPDHMEEPEPMDKKAKIGKLIEKIKMRHYAD